MDWIGFIVGFFVGIGLTIVTVAWSDRFMRGIRRDMRKQKLEIKSIKPNH